MDFLTSMPKLASTLKDFPGKKGACSEGKLESHYWTTGSQNPPTSMTNLIIQNSNLSKLLNRHVIEAENIIHNNTWVWRSFPFSQNSNTWGYPMKLIGVGGGSGQMKRVYNWTMELIGRTADKGHQCTRQTEQTNSFEGYDYQWLQGQGDCSLPWQSEAMCFWGKDVGEQPFEGSIVTTSFLRTCFNWILYASLYIVKAYGQKQ